MPQPDRSSGLMATLNRIGASVAPRSPTNWSRLALLLVAFGGLLVVSSVVPSLVRGDGLDTDRDVYGWVFPPYFLIGAWWWRLCFLEIQGRPNGDPAARRLFMRGGLAWFAISFVIVLVFLVVGAGSGDNRSDGEGDAGWPTITLLLLFGFVGLPLLMTSFIALIGRATVAWLPGNVDRT